MPTTLEGAEAAIKKQEDFMTTMDANEEKINAVVETGRRLVSDGNINADRIQEKVDSIDDRYSVRGAQRGSGTLGLPGTFATGRKSWDCRCKRPSGWVWAPGRIRSAYHRKAASSKWLPGIVILIVRYAHVSTKERKA